MDEISVVEQCLKSLLRGKFTGLKVSYNEHNMYYESPEDAVKRTYRCVDHGLGSFISDEDKQKCIDENSFWEIQWYPDTPIGSYSIVGSSLKRVFDYILNNIDGFKS